MASVVTILDPAFYTPVSTLTCNAAASPAGALTTQFAVPANCPFPIPTADGGSLPASCAPPNWPSYNFCAENNYYSPAICPMGYSMFSLGTLAGVTAPPVATGETAAICCPINWEIPLSSTLCQPISGFQSASMAYHVEPIMIRYGPADGVAQMTPVTTIIPQRAGATFTSTNAAVHAAASSHGLTTGAKAGIAIGVIVGVAILAGLFFIFCRARRSHRNDIQETYHPNQHQSQHNLREEGSEYKGIMGANVNYSNPNYSDPNYSFQTLDSVHHGKNPGSEVQSNHYASTVEL